MKTGRIEARPGQMRFGGVERCDYSDQFHG
jgi:hypothetical protein